MSKQTWNEQREVNCSEQKHLFFRKISIGIREGDGLWAAGRDWELWRWQVPWEGLAHFSAYLPRGIQFRPPVRLSEVGRERRLVSGTEDSRTSRKLHVSVLICSLNTAGFRVIAGVCIFALSTTILFALSCTIADILISKQYNVMSA
jgi:hypothetical protein